MRNANCFGLSGRTGGINQIGKRLRQKWAGSIIIGDVVLRLQGQTNVEDGIFKIKQFRQFGVNRSLQTIVERVVTDHALNLTVLENKLQTRGRVCRIEGQIGRTGFENGKRRHHQLFRARQHQSDDFSRTNTFSNQMSGHLIGACIQFAVTQCCEC